LLLFVSVLTFLNSSLSLLQHGTKFFTCFHDPKSERQLLKLEVRDVVDGEHYHLLNLLKPTGYVMHQPV